MGWWTDLAEQHPGTPNHGGPMLEQRGMVEHTAVGTYLGTIAWQMNSAASVSSHFVVAKDGRCSQMLDTTVTAWTQRLGNGHWVSIENEGDTLTPLTAAQIEKNAQLFARGHREHGWLLQLATAPSGRGLGHHSMGAENGVDWGHSACPGALIKAQKPAILARAIQLASGTTPPTGDDMTPLEAAQLNNAEQYAKALVEWSDQTEPISNTSTSTRKPNNLKAVFAALAADVTAIKAAIKAPTPVTVTVDAAQLADPAFLAALAKAVNDDAAHRLAQ